MPERLTLLLIAGGQSRRMGTAKALLPVPPADVPLIRHVAARLLPLADDGLAVANDPRICAALAGAVLAGAVPACIPDDQPGRGPLEGLATGLRRVEGWALAVAADLPCVSPPVCQHLIAQACDRWDAVVPLVDDRPQPLHALYHRRCLPAIEAALAAGQRRMDSFWPGVRLRRVPAAELRSLDPELRSFINVNTPEEWQRVRAWLATA